jgi:hypothetical protein
MKSFRITLRAARDTDDATAIRALRAVLKLAWRRFRLRTIDVHEIPDQDHPDRGRAGAARRER